MAEPYIQSNTDIINKRIDDAFIELSVLESKTGGLNNKYTELKRELLYLQNLQKSILLWARILTGISVVMWIIILLLAFL
jgi:hypothetical protein